MVKPFSDQIFKEALELIPGGVNSPVRAFRSVGGTPFVTASADGAYLETVDGQRLIDFVCTWGPAIHGHNDRLIREAIVEAAAKGTSFGTPNPYELPMAKMVIDKVPSVEQVRMCNSGTEATMSAIRLARGFTGRDKVIKFEGCYHGHVDGLLVAAGSGALTLGIPDSAGVPAAYASETVVLPFNSVEALEAVFRERGGEIAAVIVEPYPANCGFILPEPGYLESLREVTAAHGTILIFDEVMTGFRIAPGGVQEVTGILPDLTALGKVIGGGLPVGAFGGRREVMQCLAPVGPVYQAGTLSGNPLALAAGLSAVERLGPTLYPSFEAAGEAIAGAIEGAARRRGIAVQVPRAGSMFGIFFGESPVRNGKAATAADHRTYARFFHACLDGGVYLPPSGYETCFLSTAHDEAVVDEACRTFAEAINRL
ncbi:MAG: glutamate-1-semialdehyde 2,1-aminomutase [Puniceicoccaceae bacterium]